MYSSLLIAYTNVAASAVDVDGDRCDYSMKYITGTW